MTVCHHCGNEIFGTPFNCPDCGKNYCNLHTDPIVHNCALEREPTTPTPSTYVTPHYAAPSPTSVPVSPSPSAQGYVNAQQSPSAGYQQSTTSSGYSSSSVRGTTDGSFTWHHQEKMVPPNAFDPDSGIDFKGILWQYKSEFTHFIIGASLIFLIGILMYLQYIIMFNGLFTDLNNYGIPTMYDNVNWMLFMLAGFFTIAFICHELGHRQVAVHFSLQTKFRLLTFGMMLTFMSIAVSLFALITNTPPIPIPALPGAVVVLGLDKIDKRTGLCKTAGPLINLILGSILFVICFYIPKELYPLNFFFLLGAQVNFGLGTFNMLPFGILDGNNIVKWKKAVYFPLFAILITLLVITYVLSFNIVVFIPDSLTRYINFG